MHFRGCSHEDFVKWFQYKEITSQSLKFAWTLDKNNKFINNVDYYCIVNPKNLRIINLFFKCENKGMAPKITG